MSMAMKQIPGLILAVMATACGGCGSRPTPAPMPMPMPAPVPVAPAPPQGLPCDQPQLLATSTSMLARSAAEAPGMKPEGAPVCGVVGQGQTVTSLPFILEPGYCYAFLGQSLPQVGDMEMALQYDTTAVGALLPPSMAGMAGMAQGPLLVSTTPGERVSMPNRQDCYQWAFLVPATVKLVLKARTGSGPLAAQIFRKKKM
jgi:hypothetical protein